MKFIEMFAGIGGFRFGLEQIEGFECVWSNEWNQEEQKKAGIKKGFSRAHEIYRRHYGEIDTRNIRDIPSSEIPDHDLLTAGFPCQSFSKAGKSLGLNDTRGTLFFEVARVLRDKRPRHFLLENVQNLVSHEKGKTFQTILKILSDLGYRVEWEVLSSQYHGVPQKRFRVFIVGHLGGECTRKIFPIERKAGKDENQLIRIGNIDQKGHNSVWGRVYSPEGLSATLTANGGGLGAKTGLYAVVMDEYTPRAKKLSSGIDSHYHKGIDMHQTRTAILYNRKDKVKRKIDLANTLTNSDYRGLNRNQDQNAVIDNWRIRKLTPVECERLQGFPDDWTRYTDKGKELKNMARYKAIGNAVTTTVIKAIGEKLCHE